MQHLCRNASSAVARFLSFGTELALLSPQTKKEEIVVTADKGNSAGHACPEGVKFMMTVNDALLLSVDRLEEALGSDIPGHERDWAQGVGSVLATVEVELRQHAASVE